MITVRFLITFALYCLSLDIASGKPFTDGPTLTACKRNDPKLDQCFLNILKQAKPHLIRGNPELNLPPLDPVHIPRLSIHSILEDITVTGELFNLTAKGASSITPKAFKVNLEEHTWDMVLAIPLVTFVTDFDLNISLRALNVPVYGKGQCEGKTSNSFMRFHANTRVTGDKVKLDDIKINFHLGDVEVHFIKPQNPTLAQTASQFFNTNKRMMLDLVTPIAEDAAEELALRHVNKILSTVKVTDLLID